MTQKKELTKSELLKPKLLKQLPFNKEVYAVHPFDAKSILPILEESKFTWEVSIGGVLLIYVNKNQLTGLQVKIKLAGLDFKQVFNKTKIKI